MDNADDVGRAAGILGALKLGGEVASLSTILRYIKRNMGLQLPYLF